MNILFIHQSLPGQFKHLPSALARAGHKVLFLTQKAHVRLPGVRSVVYKPPRAANPQTHHYLRLQESSVLAGQQVVRALLALKGEGFVPDLVIGHPGWGELLFVKDVCPRAVLIDYCEFFYRAEGWFKGFDPEDPPLTIDQLCLERMQATHLLTTLAAADHGLAPTQWQKSVHPAAYHDRISVIFDGIDTGKVKPDPQARLTLLDGTTLAAGDEVVTYVARTLEPMRGLRTFMRALPAIVRRRPQARVVVVGRDDRPMGLAPPPPFANWREAMLAEVAIDPARVHFTGQIGYGDYLTLLRIARVHVYLTVPFVLSWSCFEALASGALVIGSDTAPVREVIRDGENGLLTDFLDPAALADKVVAALADPGAFAGLRAEARAAALADHSIDVCLPRQLALIDRLTR